MKKKTRSQNFYKEAIGLGFISFLSIVCTLLIFSIYYKMGNLEIVNFLSNPLKIIYIYIVLLGFLMALLTFYNESIFKKEKINMLKFILVIQFLLIFLIPIYLLTIVIKCEFMILVTFFILIVMCFFLFISIIFLSYYSLKEKINDIEE